MLEINSNNSFLLPNNDAIEDAMKNHNDGQSIIQVNLLSYHEIAKYKDESLNTISGEEAYKKYSKVAIKAVNKVGGRFYGIQVRLTMVGPVIDQWDDVGIVMYPNLEKFIEMIEYDWYRKLYIIVKQVKNTRLITCYNMPRHIRFQFWLQDGSENNV